MDGAGTPQLAGMVHQAGLDMEVNGILRQRCAWCGCLLLEYDLARIAVPVGQEEKRPGVFGVGSLVLQDRGMMAAVEKEAHPEHPGAYVIPDNFCALFDPGPADEGART